MGGHLNVINYTKAINKLKNINIHAKGIIDRDGKTEEEINKYKKENIYVLPYNEIEMLLLSEDVLIELNKTLKELNDEIDIDILKNKIFDKCKIKKEEIVLKIVKSRVDHILSTKKLQSPKKLEEISKELNLIFGSINIQDIYDKELRILEDILKSGDYNSLLEICNLKNDVLKQIPNSMGHKKLQSHAINIIKNNDDLKKKIKNNIIK